MIGVGILHENNFKCHLDNITSPTYFRLEIDGDVILLGDISELSNIEIQEYNIAGAFMHHAQLLDKKEKRKVCINTYDWFIKTNI